jgi:antitoxin CptB
MMTQNPVALDARRRRLVWRATHRGMKEMDLVLGAYARREAAGMDDKAIAIFEALLDESDADLHEWIVRCLTAPDRIPGQLLDNLRKTRFKADSYGKF